MDLHPTSQPLSTLVDAPPDEPPDAALDASRAGLTARDAERVAAALEAEIAASTRHVYDWAWGKWEAWCDTRGLPALPARPDALAAYLAERAETGLTYASIDVACCAIAYRHRQHGLLDPTSDPTVRRVRRGLRRIIGVAPRRQAHPVDTAELTQIVTSIDPNTTIGLRDRAILLLGYASALRPGEIAALQNSDITMRPNGLLIAIRRSKTDQEGHGQVVGVAPGTSTATDPVAALDAWLSVRPQGRGPLFTRLDHGLEPGLTPVGARTVSRMIQARAQAAGLGHLPITGHSLRAGHATTAAANGVPLAQIALQTRHRDLETLIDHYIRPTDALTQSTSRDLGL